MYFNKHNIHATIKVGKGGSFFLSINKSEGIYQEKLLNWLFNGNSLLHIEGAYIAFERDNSDKLKDFMQENIIDKGLDGNDEALESLKKAITTFFEEHLIQSLYNLEKEYHKLELLLQKISSIKIERVASLREFAVSLTPLDKANGWFFHLYTTKSISVLNKNYETVEDNVKSFSHLLNLKEATLHFSCNCDSNGIPERLLSRVSNTSSDREEEKQFALEVTKLIQNAGCVIFITKLNPDNTTQVKYLSEVTLND